MIKRIVFLIFLGILVAFSRLEAVELEPILKLDPGGHMMRIWDLVVSSDGRFLISASADKTIRVWDTKTKKEVKKILGQIGAGPDGMIYSIALSPNDKYLAVGGYLSCHNNERYGAIRIYNFKTGELIEILKSHKNVIFDLAFSDDGRYLVSGSADRTVKVWDAKNGFMLIHTFKEHNNEVYGVRIFKNKDDYSIVSTEWGNKFCLYSLNRRTVLKSTNHNSILFEKSNKYIAGAGDNKEINIFDLNLNYINTIRSKTNTMGYAFSPDGRLLLSGFWNDRTKGKNDICNVYDAERGFKKIASFNKHDNIAKAVAFLDNKTAISGGGSNYDIYFWDAYTGEEKGHITADGNAVWSVGINDRTIAFGNTMNYLNHNERGKLEKVFNLEGFTLSRVKDPSRFNRIKARYGKYSLNHTIGGNYGKFDAVLIVKESGREIARIVKESYDGYRHITYGFINDKIIISGGTYGHLIAYDLYGEKIAGFIGHTGEILSIAVDGDWLVSGSADQTIKVWNLKHLKQGKAEIYPIVSIFVSKDNEWVAWTRDGFYTASPGGDGYVGYHINRGEDRAADYVSVNQVGDLFYRSDIVAKCIQGGFEREIRAELARIGSIDEVIASGLPPQVTILSKGDISINKRDFTLNFSLEDKGGGVGRIEYRVNGVVVAHTDAVRGEDVLTKRRSGKISKKLTVSHGKNDIEVITKNKKGNIASKSVHLTVEVDDPLKDPPNLYVLAVGISDYRDQALQLKFAHKDAQDIARELKLRGKKLFRDIHVITLLNKKATAAAIEDALKSLSDIKTSDVFVLCLMGHGMAIDGNYYFIPWEAIYENRESLKEASISYEEIKSLLEKIPALKSLIVLDTCYAGLFAEQESRLMLASLSTRGMVEKTAIERLMRATGRAFLAATSRTQQAIEGYENHGVFTYALLKGLKGEADRAGEGKGVIRIDELGDFIRMEVPKITKKRWGVEQFPMRWLIGDPFEIGCVE